MQAIKSPELLWIVVVAIAAGVGATNRPPYPRNDLLMWMAWVMPVVALGVSYWWYWQGAGSWWLLVRTAVAGGIGSVFVVQAVLEKVNAGSATAGVGTLYMLVLGVVWLLDAAGFVVAAIVTLRRTGFGELLTFVKYGAMLAVGLGGLLGLFSMWGSSRVTRSQGEDKARALSAAYGRSIGARAPWDWRDGGWNWRRFRIRFAAPNAVELEVWTQYHPAQGMATVDALRGKLGAAILEALEARAAWRPELEQGELVWRARVEMEGLSEKQFLRHTAEARRLCDSALGESAPDCAWYLLGPSVDAAMRGGAKAMLATALGHTADYCRRGAKDANGEYLGVLAGQLEHLAEHGGDVEGVVAAWDRQRVRKNEYGAFVLGSLMQIKMARNYVRAMEK